MQSTPPILGRPDPRRIHSAAEHAKTKATLECFMETTNEGMNELGRQTQLTYNVASHHIGLLEGQVSSLHEEVQNVEARSDGNEGRMVVFEGRVTACENVMRGLSTQLTGLETMVANMNENLMILNARFGPPDSGNPAPKKTLKVDDTGSYGADSEPIAEPKTLMVVTDTHSPRKWVVQNKSDFNWPPGQIVCR
jgi:uncharacterized coiled-coil protein SlyX